MVLFGPWFRSAGAPALSWASNLACAIDCIGKSKKELPHEKYRERRSAIEILVAFPLQLFETAPPLMCKKAIQHPIDGRL